MNLDRDSDVFILSLGDGENRFNDDFLSEFNSALDEVEAAPAPRALVVTAEGKIWSNGLDLEWMGQNTDRIGAVLDGVHDMYARVLELGVPNAAAIQGHCFAGGAMLAVAHDFKVMREDRGYWCLPEVDINIPFTPGMAALVQARNLKRSSHEAMTTGRRYGAPEAAEAGLIDEAVPLDDVVARAVERVAPLAKNDPATLKTIKQRMYAGALALLRDRDANSLEIPDAG
jgi:enoyl-CoA hydratase/carnithine racemase